MATKTVLTQAPTVRQILAPLLAITSIIAGGGLILFSSSSIWQLAPGKLNTHEVLLPKNYPSKLYIPKLSKALDITDGQVQDNRWTVSATGVSYLTTSALPGEIGNSVIYGHNRRDILGGLPWLSVGDTIYITMQNGDLIKYEVFERKEILPTQVEILDNTLDSRLTIYTCSGFLDQSRFVVIAKKV